MSTVILRSPFVYAHEEKDHIALIVFMASENAEQSNYHLHHPVHGQIVSDRLKWP